MIPNAFGDPDDIGAYLGLVPRRHQSGDRLHRQHREVRRSTGPHSPVRGCQRHADALQGTLKLKDWAFAVARRSTMRKARIVLARRLAIIMHAMLRHGTEFKPA